MSRLTQKELSPNGKVLCTGGTSSDCNDSCMKAICKWQEKANEELWSYENAAEDNQSTYQQGMNDAWEIAKKLYLHKKSGGLSDAEVKEIFGSFTNREIFMRYTPQEVKAKIEAWEKAKQEIKVGDVVMDTENDVFVVLRKLDDFVYALLNSKGQHKYLDVKYLTKTGRAIDIQSVLEKIGG